MSYAKQMLDTYPRTLSIDADRLATTIDALSDCAQACTADTDADLSEDNLAEMARCIRFALPPPESSAAWPNMTPVPPGRCCRPAPQSARAAAMSASAMPTCRIVWSAPRPAGAANEPAGSCWTLWHSRLVVRAGRRAVAVHYR
jgi:hypothetical protein